MGLDEFEFYRYLNEVIEYTCVSIIYWKVLFLDVALHIQIKFYYPRPDKHVSTRQNYMTE